MTAKKPARKRDFEDALQDEFGFRCPACLYAFWLSNGASRPAHNHDVGRPR